VTPGQALASLRESLAEREIPTVGMTLTRRAGVLFPAARTTIGYAFGLFWWRTGREHDGRPVYAIHPACDPNGAARRIARLTAPNRCWAVETRIADANTVVRRTS
jgi:hypothetical protein